MVGIPDPPIYRVYIFVYVLYKRRNDKHISCRDALTAEYLDGHLQHSSYRLSSVREVRTVTVLVTGFRRAGGSGDPPSLSTLDICVWGTPIYIDVCSVLLLTSTPGNLYKIPGDANICPLQCIVCSG